MAGLSIEDATGDPSRPQHHDFELAVERVPAVRRAVTYAEIDGAFGEG